jgi:hypothetical protein
MTPQNSLVAEFQTLVLAASSLAAWPTERKLVIRKSRKDPSSGVAFYETRVAVRHDADPLFAFAKRHKKALAALGATLECKLTPSPQFYAVVKTSTAAPLVVDAPIVAPVEKSVSDSESTAPTEPLTPVVAEVKPKPAPKPRAKKESLAPRVAKPRSKKAKADV